MNTAPSSSALVGIFHGAVSIRAVEITESQGGSCWKRPQWVICPSRAIPEHTAQDYVQEVLGYLQWMRIFTSLGSLSQCLVTAQENPSSYSGGTPCASLSTFSFCPCILLTPHSDPDGHWRGSLSVTSMSWALSRTCSPKFLPHPPGCVLGNNPTHCV